jgi:hypothetical protein
MIDEYRNAEDQGLRIAAERPYLATTPFYLKNTQGEIPVHNGSGVFFEFNDNYYCFSNAHVLIDKLPQKSFILYSNGEAVVLGGELVFTSVPSGKRNQDNIDICVLKLSDNSVAELKRRQQIFMTIDDVVSGYTCMPADKVFVIGYPTNKVKADTKNKMVMAKPLLFRTIPHVKIDAIPGYSKDIHFLADYPFKKTVNRSTGLRERAPLPHGISGSGLWLITEPKPLEFRLFLIGIFSEFLKERSKLLSTRIDLYLDIIRQKFDASIPNKGTKVVFS